MQVEVEDLLAAVGVTVNNEPVAVFGNTFVCEPELMQEVIYTGETREGIEAFLEKRAPKFGK